MKKRIEKYNGWIHRNIFWLTLTFAFWISVAVISNFYGIWLGSTERNEYKNEIVDSVNTTVS